MSTTFRRARAESSPDREFDPDFERLTDEEKGVELLCMLRNAHPEPQPPPPPQRAARDPHYDYDHDVRGGGGGGRRVIEYKVGGGGAKLDPVLKAPGFPTFDT